MREYFTDYEKLILAIKSNELYDYLTSKPKYRFIEDKNFDTMNNFEMIVENLNYYGFEHQGFDKQVYNTIRDILKSDKFGEIYSVTKVIIEQLNLELMNRNKIKIIDEQILKDLKEAIIIHRKNFENCKKYEAVNYENGMMGLYERWDKGIYENTGKHIL